MNYVKDFAGILLSGHHLLLLYIKGGRQFLERL